MFKARYKLEDIAPFHSNRIHFCCVKSDLFRPDLLFRLLLPLSSGRRTPEDALDRNGRAGRSQP